jgi:hypothetical protein
MTELPLATPEISLFSSDPKIARFEPEIQKSRLIKSNLRYLGVSKAHVTGF